MSQSIKPYIWVLTKGVSHDVKRVSKTSFFYVPCKTALFICLWPFSKGYKWTPSSPNNLHTSTHQKKREHTYLRYHVPRLFLFLFCFCITYDQICQLNKLYVNKSPIFVNDENLIYNCHFSLAKPPQLAINNPIWKNN